jgi:hypothetical protein
LSQDFYFIISTFPPEIITIRDVIVTLIFSSAHPVSECLWDRLDIQQGRAVNRVEADDIDYCAFNPGYLYSIDGDRVWPLGASCRENASQGACKIAPWVDLKDVSFGKVHPVDNNDLSTSFQTEQCVSVLLIYNQFPADRRLASLLRRFVQAGNRTPNYADRLQDYFQCGSRSFMSLSLK